MMRFFQLSSMRDLDPDPSHNHQDDDQLVKLQEKVFQSPVILEVILLHLLQKSGLTGGSLCPRKAGKLRMVSKAWLLQINCLFQRHGEPLVFLHGKNLKQFLNFCKDRNWGTPPISLSLGPKALLSHEFCEDLSKFFNMGYLVAKLTNLRMTDPHTYKGGRLEKKIYDNGVIGFPVFPLHFKLFNLRKIWLKQLNLFSGVSEDEHVRIPRLEEFLSQILDQSEVLEVFKFEGEVWPLCPPGQYEGLTLPGTVTRVQLDTRMNLTRMLGIRDGGWRVLEGISALNLSVTTSNLFWEGEIEGILEGVKMSLEHLELEFLAGMDDVEVVLRFPVMASLKRLRIGGNVWRVERSQVLNGLGDRFPVLEQLQCWNGFTDEQLLADWCGDNSVFGEVRILRLDMVPVMGRDGMVGIPEDKMRRILKSFPNVENLRMENLDVGDMKGVRYMFGELGGQLTSLHLEFKGFLEREEELEGILIGGDVEIVSRLKRWICRGKLMEEFLESGNGGYPSLRDLVNLEELVVVVQTWKLFQNDWFWRLVRRPNMLSFKFDCEVLFEGAFMRMPKLRRLGLKGGLRPGEGVVEKWRRQEGETGDGEGRKVEFRRTSGFWDLWWEVGNWRWYILWVIGWVLIIFWGGGGGDVRKGLRNNTGGL